MPTGDPRDVPGPKSLYNPSVTNPSTLGVCGDSSSTSIPWGYYPPPYQPPYVPVIPPPPIIPPTPLRAWTCPKCGRVWSELQMGCLICNASVTTPPPALNPNITITYQNNEEPITSGYLRVEHTTDLQGSCNVAGCPSCKTSAVTEGE